MENPRSRLQQVLVGVGLLNIFEDASLSLRDGL